jgi:hypothetical protein
MGVKVPAGAAHDGAMAFDYGGQMREEAKQEQLPTHLRVMQNGMEVELIDEIDGQKVAYLIQTQDFNAWDFMDKRYPFPKPDRVKKVTTNG